MSKAWTFAIVAASLAAIGAAVALADFKQDKDTANVVYGAGAADATAKCGRHEHVNFGGFKTNTKGESLGSGPLVWPRGMGPKGPDTDKWTAEASTNSFNGGRLTAIAYCKGGGEPKVVRKRQILLPSSAGDEFRKVKVSCKHGRNVIGGGWSAPEPDPTDQNDLVIMGLERTSDKTLQVSVAFENPTGDPRGVTAIALCGKGKAPKEVDQKQAVREFHDATAKAECPRSKEVVFGGFRGAYNILSGKNGLIFGFYLAGDDTIRVYAAHNGVAPTSPKDTSFVHAIAYCK